MFHQRKHNFHCCPFARNSHAVVFNFLGNFGKRKGKNNLEPYASHNMNASLLIMPARNESNIYD